MNEADEIMLTVEHLQSVLENLVVRGLRSAGAKELTTLSNLRGEFDRIGAHHLGERIATLHAAMKKEDRSAAQALLNAQASLRVFERVLTLELARAALAQLSEGAMNRR